MRTIKPKSQSFVKLIGKAINQNIVRECYRCHNVFIVNCEDYIFDKCGKKVYSNDPDKKYEQPGWCCEECTNEILRIKNL